MSVLGRIVLCFIAVVFMFGLQSAAPSPDPEQPIAASPSPPSDVSPHSEFPPQPSARLKNQSLAAESSAPSKNRIIEKWENLLRNSDSAELKFHCRRIRTDRDLSVEHAEPLVKYDVIVRAQAVMKRDAHHLLAWEGEDASDGNAAHPVLKLQFENGEIREDLWYPAAQQYRTKRYQAPTPQGANDTTYENGCQIGTLLSTWVGDSWMLNFFHERLKGAEPYKAATQHPHHDCYIALKVDHPPYADREEGSTEQTVDIFYFDADGCLSGWDTIVTMTSKTSEVVVSQRRSYEFTFDLDG